MDPLHFGYSWAVGGKTLGMALLAVTVVAADGTEAGPRRDGPDPGVPPQLPALRARFTGIFLQRNRRARRDMIAGTAVVYAWDARAARLRFLHRDAP